MPITVRELSVVPNPWIEDCIDKRGFPAGRVHVDHHEHSPIQGSFVGCKIVDVREIASAVVQKIGKKTIEISAAVNDHRVAYVRKPLNIPNTAYYRDAISRGELFAADMKTAKAAGLTKFVPVEEAMSAARKNAIAHFDARTEEDAFNQLAEMDESYPDHEPLWLKSDEELEAEAKAAKATADAPVPALSTKPGKSESKGSV